MKLVLVNDMLLLVHDLERNGSRFGELVSLHVGKQRIAAIPNRAPRVEDEVQRVGQVSPPRRLICEDRPAGGAGREMGRGVIGLRMTLGGGSDVAHRNADLVGA